MTTTEPGTVGPRSITFVDDRYFSMRGGQLTMLTIASRAAEQGHLPTILTLGDGELASGARNRGLDVQLAELPPTLDSYEGRFRSGPAHLRARAAIDAAALGLKLYRHRAMRSADCIYLSSLRSTMYCWPLMFDARTSVWYAQGSADLGAASTVASRVPTSLVAVCSASLPSVGLRSHSARDRLTEVIPVGVDVRNLRFSARDMEQGEKLTLVVVGEVRAAKGQLRAAEIAAALAETLTKPVELRLVGEVTEHDYLGSIRSLLQETGVELSVDGHLSSSEEIYGRGHCLLITSQIEGTPRVAAEALASGMPVLADDVGGVKEYVGGVAGVSIVARDAPAKVVARSVLDLVAGYQPHDIRVAAQRFDQVCMADAILAILTSRSRHSPRRLLNKDDPV